MPQDDANKAGAVRPVLQDFTVETQRDEDGVLVVGASIPDDEMEALLHSQAYVYARDQDGCVIEMTLDMDFESVNARPVELRGDQVVYLNEAAAPSP